MLQEVLAVEDSPRWMALRRRACSSAERKAAQSHNPLTPATASHLQCPRPAPGLTLAGVSESLLDESPKASRSASRQWYSPPSLRLAQDAGLGRWMETLANSRLPADAWVGRLLISCTRPASVGSATARSWPRS
jgi:hypothetical protein